MIPASKILCEDSLMLVKAFEDEKAGVKIGQVSVPWVNVLCTVLSSAFLTISRAVPNILKGLFQPGHGGDGFGETLSGTALLPGVSHSLLTPRKEASALWSS